MVLRLGNGFYGQTRAAQFKEAYINAFNQMENNFHPSVLSDAAHNATAFLFLHFIHSSGLVTAVYPMLEKRTLRWP